MDNAECLDLIEKVKNTFAITHSINVMTMLVFECMIFSQSVEGN